MGLFLEPAIIPDCTEDELRAALRVLEGTNTPVRQLKAAECRVKTRNSGVGVLFNDYCGGYGEFAKELSAQLDKLVLHLYLYDDDFWGYFCCEKGQMLDEFTPMPDYFGEVSEEERQRVEGSSVLIAERFHVPQAEIERYLTTWAWDVLDADTLPKAYESDQATVGDCWQMADFMEKLGYPYDWE